MRNKLLWGLLTLALVISPSNMAAQGLSSIVGTVTDSSSAVVPSARITIIQEATAATRTVTSGAQGEYVVPALRPGRYSLTVEFTGFQKYTQTGITLLADESRTVNVVLQVGTAVEGVTVTTTPPQVDTYTPTLKEVVDEKRMLEMPLNGRNAAQLTTLVAGVVALSGDADQGVTKTFPAAVPISTNGSRQNQVSFMMDGGNNVDQFTNVNMPFPFPDAVQEFSVQTSNYSARYGQNAGGVVNIVTKAGTNQAHGGVFDFTRNAVLNARNTFSSSRDQLKRNQFGGTLGGPLNIPHLYRGKDRTFFFVGSQGTTLRNTFGSNRVFAARPASLQGDLSYLLDKTNPANTTGRAVQLMDPDSGTPFANNQIPLSRFSSGPGYNLLSKYIPLSDASGLTTYSSQLYQNFYEVVGRVDHNISDSDHLFVRYFADHFSQAPLYINQNLLTNAAGSRIFTQSYTLGEVHTFRPNLINDFNFTFGRVFSHRGPAESVPSVRDLGVNIWQPAQYVGMESIIVSGYFTVGNTAPAEFIRNTFNWTDDLTWIHGRHEFSFGGQLTRAQLDLNNFFRTPGDFTFTGDKSGDALADLLLGKVRTFVQGNGQYGRNRNTYTGLYAQDTFRAHRRLVLDFGVRWDPWFPVTEKGGRVVAFRPDAYARGERSIVYANALPGSFYPGDPGFIPNGLRSSLWQVAPRFGFAYDLSGTGRTSVRGGVGLFYDSRSVMTTNWEMLSNTPYSPQISITEPAGGFANPYSGAASPFPAAFPAAKDAVFPKPVPIVAYDPTGNYQVPVTYQWNLTLEHQLASEWMLRAAYVGSHASHIRESVNLNPAVYIPGSTLGTDARRMFKDYSTVYIGSNDVNSSYNSLQLTLEKRFSRSFSVLANYTWSKSIDDLPFGGGVTSVGGDKVAAMAWTDPNFRRFERGPSDFDRQHNFVLSAVWELPKLSRQAALLRGMAGGWQVSAIVNARTGGPLTLMAGTDYSKTGTGRDRAVDLGGEHYESGACATTLNCRNWLVANSFGMPSVGTYGNLGKGAVRGPGLFFTDFGVFKMFAFSERARLQVRGEFFNFLNQVNYSDPRTQLGNGFGQIFGARDPRISQIALKLSF